MNKTEISYSHWLLRIEPTNQERFKDIKQIVAAFLIYSNNQRSAACSK
jgi:hypothetical protein